MRMERQTDTYDEANNPFRNFSNVPKNVVLIHFDLRTCYLN
jgi:hypothetical protein